MTGDSRVRMPFGKYRGLPLHDVPADYLAWVLDNIDLDRRPTLRDLIRDRLGVVDRPPDLREKVRDWYRGLAFDYHPDRRRG